MSMRDGGKQPSLRGLVPIAFTVFVTVAGIAGLTIWAWLYVSPRNPDPTAYQDVSGPQQDYWPGGADCEPKRLNSLPPKEAPRERERCAKAAKDHYESQTALKEAVRANELAEEGLRLSAQQARAAFVQTIATVLAFGAAILAAEFAGFAAWHAKRSADADNDALEATRLASEAARKDAAKQARKMTDQLNIAADTASAMRETAQQAREANQLASQTSASQLRPYVYVLGEFVGIASEANGIRSELGDIALAGFSIRNFGQTPAKNVAVRASVTVGGYWSDPRPIDLSEAKTIHRADIPPSHQIIMDGYSVSGLRGLHRELSNSEKSIFFFGEITYEDGFGKKYRTEFNRALTGPDYFHNKFVTPPTGNVAT
jgi:hypothetical protein